MQRFITEPVISLLDHERKEREKEKNLKRDGVKFSSNFIVIR